jgi:hypothetical protein
VTPEIRAFEFSLGLFSVLIGLAVADVATSFHRLVRHDRVVRWDPLVLMSAGFALVITVGMWFDLWGIRNATSVRHFLFYLLLVGAFLVLFLIAAASLPDEVSGDVDLREYYASNQRYFWSLITLFELVYVALGVFFLSPVYARLPRALIGIISLQWTAVIIVPALLTVIRSRLLHYLGLGILFAVVFWHYSAYAIT